MRTGTQSTMRTVLTFVSGIAFSIALAAVAGYVAVSQGLIPAGADQKPGHFERWAAHTSLDATIARESKHLSNPLQPSDANLSDGIHAYAANCAVCHGAADGKASNLAKGFYIRAPQLASHGVEDDDESETYWKIEHGIRFSAMPSYSATLSTGDAWKIAMFLKRMDKLPAAVEPTWKAVPSSETH
jgi:mono/diheme cytochrome c family protein